MNTHDTSLQHSNPEGRQADPDNTPVYTPALDVYADDDNFLIVAELPGVRADDLQIDLEQGELRIEATGQGRRYRRLLRVPQGIDADGIKARLNEGLLRLTVPKPEQVRPRRIAVS